MVLTYISENTYLKIFHKVISEKEKQLNIELPKDFKVFLSLSGGGVFETSQEYPKVKAQNKEFGLSELYGINRRSLDYINEDEYFQDLQIIMEGEDIDFSKYLTIGFEENTGWYILSLDEKSYGNIFYFNSEYASCEYELIPIAPTFTAFIKKIIDENGGYIKNLSEIYEEMIKGEKVPLIQD